MQRKNIPFKTCLSCDYNWNSRDDFLQDPDINLVGYQVHFKKLNTGLLLFDHSCGANLSLKVELFVDLYSGTVFRNNLAGTKECPEYCLRQGELRDCPARCECVFVRKIIQIIKNWPKIRK